MGLLVLGRGLVQFLVLAIRIVIDGGVDGFAPGLGAEGVYVFALGKLDGLYEGLAEIGKGRSSLELDLALGGGGEETPESGAEIAGGEIFAGEEIGDVAAHFVGSAGLRFLAGMVVAEVRMTGKEGSAAAVAIGEGERTQSGAVFSPCDRRAVLFKRDGSAIVFTCDGMTAFFDCDGRAVFFMRDGKAVFLNCDGRAAFLNGDRRAVNGATSRHGSLQKRRI